MSEYASADHQQGIERKISEEREKSAQNARHERIGAAALKRTRSAKTALEH